MGAKSSRNTTQNNRSDGHLLEYFRNTFVRGGGGTNAAAAQGLTATGGVISDYSDPGSGAIYRAHIFTSSGTFSVSALGTFGSNVEYLVVAGGGGGGGQIGGGGGAGGLRTNLSGHPLAGSAFPVSTTPGSYPITIGAGGVGGIAPSSLNATNGGTSSFGPVSTDGGGYGGSYSPLPGAGNPGGSGGGSSQYVTSQASGAGNSPTPYSPPQGNPGGPASGNGGSDAGPGEWAAGGGGAGGAGGASTGTLGGSGGAGVQVAIAGPPTSTGVGALNPGPGEYQWFAGGGGGASNSGGVAPGGVGGGGTGGSNSPATPAIAGAYSTGGGGGGARDYPAPPGGAYEGRNGGSGIVVVRYQIGQLTATAKATGGAISYYGGKTIHTFTSTGTFVAPGTFNETVEYVVIGGGGAGGQQGGNDDGHGGGASGSYITGTTPISTPQTITVQVGSGAANSPHPAGTGTASFFGPPITAPGGGSGGGSANGISGGSGGGGSAGGGPKTGGPATGAPFPGTIGSTPSAGWGHAGGSAPAGGANGGGGGGGGGAGGAGTANAGSGTAGGPGGPGIQLPATFRNPAFIAPGTGPGRGFGGPGPTSAPTPNGFDTSGNFWFAAGGGGGTWGYVGPQVGGVGGGPAGPYAGAGNGASHNPTGASPRVVATSGLENTGSGGGGGTSSSSPFLTAGKGGSGIVLIAYPS